MRKVGVGVAALFIGAALCLTACSSGMVSAQGTWGDRGETAKPYLELAKGGVLMGSDGCNQLHGSWEQSGTTVKFGPIASTLMACEGVDTWLSKAASAKVAGSTMTVYNSAHASIGTLRKD
jgi:heat shock protein HslJ